MTVTELYLYLRELIKDNKGDYNVTCEAFCVEIDTNSIDIDDNKKEISL